MLRSFTIAKTSRSSLPYKMLAISSHGSCLSCCSPSAASVAAERSTRLQDTIDVMSSLCTCLQHASLASVRVEAPHFTQLSHRYCTQVADLAAKALVQLHGVEHIANWDRNAPEVAYVAALRSHVLSFWGRFIALASLSDH